MPKFRDLTDQPFGRLVAKRVAGNSRSGYLWECECSCGNTTVVRGGHLTNGNTTSCGCHRAEALLASHTKHGLSTTQEYKIWGDIKARCYWKGKEGYHNYGGRNIRMCERWKNSFEAFLEDVGPRPSPEFSIERRDNNGDYTPDNCYWATRKEQANNTRRNRYLTYQGQTKTVAQWGEYIGIRCGLLRQRLFRGWPVERALSTPVRERA